MSIYEELRVILDSHPSGAPKSEAFDQILKMLFSPEEAAVAVHMNLAPRSVEKIASDAGIPVEEAGRLLEGMAERVVIFSREKDGKKSYGLMPTIPGLFEFPFMRGGGTPEHERLGKLWEDYHHEAMGASFAGNPTPLARVIPVEHAINAKSQVHPYEEVARLIDQADYRAVAQCACRVSVGACDAPRDVCLIFDSPARFLVERQFAREISREEAYNVLDRSEKAGLVHTSNNSADKASFICNCCRCCCTILRGRTQLDLSNAFAPSGFTAQVDKDACTGCGICADERCPMGAIEVWDDIASADMEQCIGCGLCVTECPVDAITLLRREERREVPATAQEMGARILKEKGKLEQFMRVMQK